MTYIAIEGADGSGTTTQARLLAWRLAASHKAHLCCEPTDSPIGQLVREFFEGKHGALPNWRTMFHLFQADRERTDEATRELNKDRVIVSDRCFMSSLVYQSASAFFAGGEEEEEEAFDLVDGNCAHLLKPDICIVLDVNYLTVKERKLARGSVSEDHYEKNSEFAIKVLERYSGIEGPGVVKIDGNGSEEEVAEAVFQAVSAIL